MHILIGIDDTDNLDSPGTGALASRIAAELESNGWGTSGFVTRHQLLVHTDIPYTSHNSSMCFPAEIADDCLDQVIAHAADVLVRESAAGSDAGLCVIVLDRLLESEELIRFGQAAKQSVLTKSSAYGLARRAGVHLSEHGGTGLGVIGALAATGLRLGGNDGRMRGKLAFTNPGGVVTVAELYARNDVQEVRALDGGIVSLKDVVRLGEKVKTVLLNGNAVLFLVAVDGSAEGARWQTCPRQLLKKY
jgi:hypothetical protein